MLKATLKKWIEFVVSYLLLIHVLTGGGLLTYIIYLLYDYYIYQPRLMQLINPELIK